MLKRTRCLALLTAAVGALLGCLVATNKVLSLLWKEVVNGEPGSEQTRTMAC